MNWVQVGRFYRSFQFPFDWRTLPLKFKLFLFILIEFWADGLSICWEGYLYSCMGGIGFTVHGTVGFLYPEVVNCRGSWNSVAYPCRTWGAACFLCSYLIISNSMHVSTNLFNLTYSYFIETDIHKLPVKCDDTCNTAIYFEWMDSNKDWRLWSVWYSWGAYFSDDIRSI